MTQYDYYKLFYIIERLLNQEKLEEVLIVIHKISENLPTDKDIKNMFNLQAGNVFHVYGFKLMTEEKYTEAYRMYKKALQHFESVEDRKDGNYETAQNQIEDLNYFIERIPELLEKTKQNSEK